MPGAMRAARTKVRSVRLKSNGAVLYVLPDPRKETSQHVFNVLQDCLNTVSDLYSGDLGGFVLVPWSLSKAGDFSSFVCCEGSYPRWNDLPNWIAEAVRRDLVEREARSLIDEEG